MWAPGGTGCVPPTRPPSPPAAPFTRVCLPATPPKVQGRPPLGEDVSAGAALPLAKAPRFLTGMNRAPGVDPAEPRSRGFGERSSLLSWTAQPAGHGPPSNGQIKVVPGREKGRERQQGWGLGAGRGHRQSLSAEVTVSGGDAPPCTLGGRPRRHAGRAGPEVPPSAAGAGHRGSLGTAPAPLPSVRWAHWARGLGTRLSRKAACSVSRLGDTAFCPHSAPGKTALNGQQCSAPGRVPGRALPVAVLPPAREGGGDLPVSTARPPASPRLLNPVGEPLRTDGVVSSLRICPVANAGLAPRGRRPPSSALACVRHTTPRARSAVLPPEGGFWGFPENREAGLQAGKHAHQGPCCRAGLPGRTPGPAETEAASVQPAAPNEHLTRFPPYPKGIGNSDAFFKISRKQHLL